MFESTEFIVPRVDVVRHPSASASTPILVPGPVALTSQKSWRSHDDTFDVYAEELPNSESDAEDDDDDLGQDDDRWSDSSDSRASYESDGEWDAQLEQATHAAHALALSPSLPRIVVTPPADESLVYEPPNVDGARLSAATWSFAAQYHVLVASGEALRMRLRLRDDRALRRRLMHTQALARKLGMPVHDTEWFQRPRAPRAIRDIVVSAEAREERPVITHAVRLEVRVETAKIRGVGPKTAAFFSHTYVSAPPPPPPAPATRSKTSSFFNALVMSEPVSVAVPMGLPALAVTSPGLASRLAPSPSLRGPTSWT